MTLSSPFLDELEREVARGLHRDSPFADEETAAESMSGRAIAPDDFADEVDPEDDELTGEAGAEGGAVEEWLSFPWWTRPSVQAAIPSSQLEWPGATAEQLAFMRRVYDAHVTRSKARGDTFTPSLPSSALDTIEGEHMAQKDAAAQAKLLLRAARSDLDAAGLADRVRIGITSAYRSADRQLDIWQGKGGGGRRGFPHYYRQTQAARRRFSDEHGPEAAQALVAYMGKYVAAPGYSNHQDGLAIDFGTGEVGASGLGKIGPKSWFHKWLSNDRNANAARFGFHPYEEEAWHWVYRPKAIAREDQIADPWATPSAGSVAAGEYDVPKVKMLADHRGRSPDMLLSWNAMPAGTTAVDVVVHFHGYGKPNLQLRDDIRRWAGLDLAPIADATGQGRSRPTLTVLPRGNYTGVKVGSIYRYTFPAVTPEGALNKLIAVALKEFGAKAGITPTMGRLILTAHSGGGAPLLRILGFIDPSIVHEVHVYDGLYQDASALAKWAAKHIRRDRASVEAGGAADGGMRVFFRPGTAKYSRRLANALTRALAGAPDSVQRRYRVERSGFGHWEIPRQFGFRVLADVAADVPGIVEGPMVREASDEAGAVEIGEQLESPMMEAEVGEDEQWESEDADDAGELDEAMASSFGETPFADEASDSQGTNGMAAEAVDLGASSDGEYELGEDEDEAFETEREAEGTEPMSASSAGPSEVDFLELARELQQLSSEVNGSPGGSEPDLQLSQFLPIFSPDPPSPSADATVAVPPFGAVERLRIPVPVLNAAQSANAIAWNRSNHPTTSGVDPNHIRMDLARYVSPTAVSLAIVAFNVRNPSAQIAPGTPPIDAVFVESIHQFQAKCFFEETSQVDGKAGESTLDSLGIVERTGMNSVDRPNPDAVTRLREVEKNGSIGNGFTANNWFDSMVNPTFLGWRFTRGVHVAYVRKLRIAEQALLAQPAYRGMTPVELGKALGFTSMAEEHKGARPTATSRSMHTYGLAADILYLQNPWVRGADFTAALKDAARLVSGVAITENTSQRFFENIRAGRTTAEIFDLLAQRNQDFRTLLTIADDVAQIEALITQRRAAGTPGIFASAAETVEQAARRWQTRIRDHRANMRSGSSPFRGAGNLLRDPLRGFLNLHKDLVVALRENACMAWGAVDIGTSPDGNGDMMHFDARACGLGDRLATEGNNARVEADHPCVPCGAAGT
jgi:LAS superfamily LD-carboxypeptidase LdcB